MTTSLRELRGAALATALAAIFLAACATATPAPTAEFALARAAIDDAVSAGGAQYAPMALRSAQDRLDRANAALASGANRDAGRFAEEAETDARLAATIARAAKAELAEAEVQSGIRALEEEIARASVPR